MNKHVNKVRKATGRAEAITAGRQQNKQQYLIIQLMKKKESIKTGQERQQSHYTKKYSKFLAHYINRPPTTFPPRLMFTYRTLQYIWTVENDAFSSH